MEFFCNEIVLISKKTTLSKSSMLYKLDPKIVNTVLRVGGRLGEANLDYDFKHLIILSERNHLTTLVISDVHANSVGHGRINTTLNCLCQRFWIINSKVTVKRVLNQWTTCKKTHSRLTNQLMSNLLQARFQIHQPPFCHAGLESSPDLRFITTSEYQMDV